MDFYDKLLTFKALNKIGFREIGEVVEMNETTIRSAINRKSLSNLQIKEITTRFSLDDKTKVSESATKYKIEKTLNGLHPLDIIEHIYKNKDDFFELISFRELVKDLLVDEKIDSLENQITELKKSVDKLLKES